MSEKTCNAAREKVSRMKQYSKDDILIFTLMTVIGILCVWMYAEIPNAHAEFQYISGPSPPMINHDKILMIVTNAPIIVQRNVYLFELRTFDNNLVTKTTPWDEFIGNQGDLGGVSINATLYNYDNKTIIHKWSGLTNQFGWFKGSVLMKNETPNQVYRVVFNATYPHMENSSKTFSFVLMDHREVGELG